MRLIVWVLLYMAVCFVSVLFAALPFMLHTNSFHCGATLNIFL